MKTHRLLPLIAALSLAVLPLVHGAEKPAPANPDAAEPASPADRWPELKGYTFDQRDLFVAGLKELEARVDAQISELVAKRATMEASNTTTKEWDFAMQEMSRARTNLKSTSDDMTKAARTNWDQQKDKVGLAWVQTQNAYAKVKSSTTN